MQTSSMDFLFNEPLLQTSETVKSGLIHKRKAKRNKGVALLKQETLGEAFQGLPEEGESYHIVSNGKFDFWSFIPVLVERLGNSKVEFIGSTWTLNRGNAVEMLEMYDAEKLRSVHLMTGTYFKSRESSVYATIVEGLMERGQRFVCFENHSKVALLSNGVDYLVIEGSANFTSNPRVEQYVLTNDRGLFEFHKEWMISMFDDGK